MKESTKKKKPENVISHSKNSPCDDRIDAIILRSSIVVHFWQINQRIDVRFLDYFFFLLILIFIRSNDKMQPTPSVQLINEFRIEK